MTDEEWAYVRTIGTSLEAMFQFVGSGNNKKAADSHIEGLQEKARAVIEHRKLAKATAPRAMRIREDE